MTIEPTNEAAAGQGEGGRGSRLASSLVAAGIFLSRIAGLLREGVFSHYFGTTAYADVFRAGIRAPNVLQNLLGEGTLSASFIPVYSELLHKGRDEEAGRMAGAVFGLLVALAGGLCLLGIFFAPLLVSVLTPGFEGEQRALTIVVVRIIFPMTGVLVLSAWALGILNSHRRFFIPYVAPVVWSASIIATLIFFGGRLPLDRLVIAVAWGAVIGGVLQFGVQLPWVFKLERRLRPSLDHRFPPVREAVRNATPAIAGRGVVQLSGYVDIILASLLAAGAVSAIGYAQTLYMLPVSLFGMSVAAAELPELARQRESSLEELRVRTNGALERIAFFVVPSFVAFVALGDLAVAALYQRGAFTPSDTLFVYLTLVALSVGLIASTGTRLFSSTFFALRDTKTPARYAVRRVLIAAVLSFVLMVQFEPIERLGLSAGIFGNLTIGEQNLGAVGLAAGSGLAAWVEWLLLRRRLRERLGMVGAGGAKLARMFAAALLGAAAGWGMRLALGSLRPRVLAAVDVEMLAAAWPILTAAVVFASFGIAYLLAAGALGLSEARLLGDRIRRLAR